MKTATILACILLAAFSLDASARCGPSRDKYTKPAKPVVITLAGPDRSAPVFYWHDSRRWVVLYFSPADILERLQRIVDESRAKDPARAQQPSRWEKLLNDLKADLPLKDNVDLFKYVLKDTDHVGIVEYVLADLMKEGKVTVDNWIYRDDKRSSNGVEGDPTTIQMVSAMGGPEEAGRTFCTMKGEELLSIWYIIYD